MTGVTLREIGEKRVVCVPTGLLLVCVSWFVCGSPTEVIFLVGTRTPAGGPEHVPVMVYTQVFATFFLYLLPLDLAGARVDLAAGLRNA